MPASPCTSALLEADTDDLPRVVIAEDDAPLRTLLRLVLSRDGRLQVAAEGRDGAEALALVDRHDPDLLLLDLSMPDVDGFEVLRALQGQARPRVVVLTALGEASAEEDIEGRVRRLGAVAYLSKASAFHCLADALVSVMTADRPPSA